MLTQCALTIRETAPPLEHGGVGKPSLTGVGKLHPKFLCTNMLER